MDLGSGKLRRHSINTLRCAVHPSHGFAWTNGKAVFLTQFGIFDDLLESNSTVQLGTFECVYSVGWCTAETCLSNGLLALTHDTSVTIWTASGCSPELTFQQIRKVSISALPDGCVWNPQRDVLCVMTAHQCSLYFRHLTNKGSFLLPIIDSGNISCGCWSADGQKLVLGVGSLVLGNFDSAISLYSVMDMMKNLPAPLPSNKPSDHCWSPQMNIYEWSDIDKSIADYTMNVWKIPSVDGRVCSLACVDATKFICATELPLDRLCHASKLDMFQMPDFSETGHRSETSSQSDASCHSNNGSETELFALSGRSPTVSHTQQLLNLQKNMKMVPQTDSSQLVLFEVGELSKPDNIRKLCRADLPCLLSPDLLHSTGCLIVVGSNNHSVLCVFSVAGDRLLKSHDIALDKDERPKGVCRSPQRVSGRSSASSATNGSLTEPADPVALLMIGRQPSVPEIFVPSSTSADYQMILRRVNIATTGVNFVPAVASKQSPPSAVKLVNFSRSNPDVSAPCRPPRSLAVNFSVANITDNCSKKLRSPDMREHLSSAVVSSASNSSSTIPNNKLILPGDAVSPDDPKQQRKNVTGGIVSEVDAGSSDELEVEYADFRESAANFFHGFGVGRPCTSDKKPLIRSGNGESERVEKWFEKTRAAMNLGNKSVGRPFSSSDSAGEGKILAPTAATNLSHFSELATVDEGSNSAAADRLSSSSNPNGAASFRELYRQVELLRTELSTQVEQLSVLQSKLDQMLSKASSSTKQRAVRRASNPDLVYIVACAEGFDVTAPRAFVLDDGRLQLEAVKQTFGLTVVELIINNIPCVVGADSSGYIPLEFSCGQTVRISVPTLNRFSV